MVGIPTFAKKFTIDKKRVRAMIDSGILSGEQLDGRVFINMDALTAAAEAEGFVCQWLHQARG